MDLYDRISKYLHYEQTLFLPEKIILIFKGSHCSFFESCAIFFVRFCHYCNKKIANTMRLYQIVDM